MTMPMTVLERCMFSAVSIMMALFFALPATVVKAQPVAEADRLKQAIATALTDLGDWCRRRNLDHEAKKHIDAALEIVPDFPPAARLGDRLRDQNRMTDAIQRSYERQLERDGKRIAQLFCELYALSLSTARNAPSHAESEPYLRKAFAYHADTAIEFLDRTAVAQLDRDPVRAQQLLAVAQKMQPAERRAGQLRQVELKVAQVRPILRTATTHEMKYYLSLPKGWEPGGKYPVLVACEGAGCNWLGAHNIYANGRGDTPFIVITPMSFTNTNAIVAAKYQYPAELLERVNNGQPTRIEFDEAGLLAVLADVQREFGGKPKIFITGFSGGGILTWAMVLRHPAKVAAASPMCGNFAGYIILANADLPMPPDPALPVHAFQGNRDAHLEALDQQWASALAACQQRGFTNVQREMFDGGHSNSGSRAIEFFRQHLNRAD